MEILLISNLYPSQENLAEDKNTKALYNIFRKMDELQKIKIEVTRPLMMPIEYKKYLQMNKSKKQSICINNTRVHLLPFWKIPKTNYYFHKNLAHKILERTSLTNINVVIAHRLHCAKVGLEISKKNKIPLIIGLHQSDIRILRNNKKSLYYTDVLKAGIKIGCRSYSIYYEMCKLFPEYKDKFFLLLSGIDKKRILPLQVFKSKQLSWKNHKRKIKFITVASLITLKNIDINLKALSKIEKTIDWEYKILGEGKELEALKMLSSELGITDKVFFLGHQNTEKVYKELEGSDIFIMVSEPESFGLVYLEAMAKGCITIGAFNNGIDGIVKNRVNGFLCIPRDVESLNRILNEIFSMNSLEMENLISFMHKTISNYTEEETVDKYHRLLSDSIHN
ncbi:glycosyltransferase [Planococcus sp. FY231025]|uniref:glycosyltransferase n=1 Tax=Planococcus sp. FY231025 TaxID=3455699 RepID=UPI003F8F2529